MCVKNYKRFGTISSLQVNKLVCLNGCCQKTQGYLFGTNELY